MMLQNVRSGKKQIFTKVKISLFAYNTTKVVFFVKKNVKKQFSILNPFPKGERTLNPAPALPFGEGATAAVFGCSIPALLGRGGGVQLQFYSPPGSGAKGNDSSTVCVKIPIKTPVRIAPAPMPTHFQGERFWIVNKLLFIFKSGLATLLTSK